jgi:pentatricopeptide repeat protein
MLKHYGMKSEDEVFELVFKKCRSYFDEMIQAGCVPNAKTVNTMLHVYLKTQQPLDDALAFFETEIQQRFLNQSETAVLQQSSAEIFDYILRQHQEVQASKKEGDNRSTRLQSIDSTVLDHDGNTANPKALVDTTTFNLLMAIHLRRKEFDKALDVMDRQMPNVSIQPDQNSFAMMIDRSIDLRRPEIGELMVNALKKIRSQRGPILGGLVVDSGPLEHVLVRLKQRSGDSAALVKDIDWLRSGKRLSNNVFAKKEKRDMK